MSNPSDRIGPSPVASAGTKDCYPVRVAIGGRLDGRAACTSPCSALGLHFLACRPDVCSSSDAPVWRVSSAASHERVTMHRPVVSLPCRRAPACAPAVLPYWWLWRRAWRSRWCKGGRPRSCKRELPSCTSPALCHLTGDMGVTRRAARRAWVCQHPSALECAQGRFASSAVRGACVLPPPAGCPCPS